MKSKIGKITTIHNKMTKDQNLEEMCVWVKGSTNPKTMKPELPKICYQDCDGYKYNKMCKYYMNDKQD